MQMLPILTGLRLYLLCVLVCETTAERPQLLSNLAEMYTHPLKTSIIPTDKSPVMPPGLL